MTAGVDADEPPEGAIEPGRVELAVPCNLDRVVGVREVHRGNLSDAFQQLLTGPDGESHTCASASDL